MMQTFIFKISVLENLYDADVFYNIDRKYG